MYYSYSTYYSIIGFFRDVCKDFILSVHIGLVYKHSRFENIRMHCTCSNLKILYIYLKILQTVFHFLRVFNKDNHWLF